MKKVSLLSLACVLCVLFWSCGSGLNGTYADSSGLVSYTFKSNGVVSVSAMGAEIEQKYKVENGKVKIVSPQGDLVLTITDDATITGPMGMTLTKQK